MPKELQKRICDRCKDTRSLREGNKLQNFWELCGALFIYHAFGSGFVAVASTLPPLEGDGECGLFLAPSTTADSVYGVFTGRDISENAIIAFGDICVPIVDLSWHLSDDQRMVNHLQALNKYSRDGFKVGMGTESERGDVHALCFGVDSLAKAGNTTNFGPPSLEYDDCGYHRSASVAAGGFSPYGNATSIATANIEAGAELFKDFGRAFDRDKRQIISHGSSRNNTRSLEWLRANGACLDNIRLGLSSLPRAGHGAFATRRIAAGSIVTVSPLIVLPNDSFMAMYKFHQRIPSDGTKPNGWWYRLMDERQTWQIWLNYCFGGASTPLLCPIGAGVNLINHNKLRANVLVRWATDFPSLHDHSFVLGGAHSYHEPQIAFQYVALEEIQEGDELFMDYGDDWVAAWVKHSVDYTFADDHYISSHSYNKMFDDMPFRTEAQVKFDPYPSHLQLRCHTGLLTQPRHMNATYDWSGDAGYPCAVIDHFVEFAQELYTVAVDVSIDDAKDGSKLQRIRLTDIPRSALLFFDQPYTTDIHQSSAFRHSIGLPDGVDYPFEIERQVHPF